MVTKPETVTPPAPGPVCANCGAPLYGEYCYACGQPVKGLIRHLSGVLGDVLDTLLNIDSRVIRTLPALYLKPGFLSLEYFAGRRVRYVTPFRLMFFLALIAFFVMQLAVNSGSWVNFGGGKKANSFQQAQTEAQVIAQEKQALDKIDKELADPALPAIARDSLKVARDKMRRDAAERKAELQQSGPAAAKSVGASPALPMPAGTLVSGRNAGRKADLGVADDDGWDLPRDRIHLGWLPGFANDWLNRAGDRMHDNVNAMRHGTREERAAAVRRLVVGALSVLPQTMFVLIPLFALILKVFYIFKRRLYMEHLIVALHSHAFIFLSILVFFALGAVRGLSQSAWLTVPLGLATAAAWIWLFVYLWLMQKRVYRQGWFFTTVKYWCVGICYSVLLSFSIGVAFLMSLAQA
ncbi:MAG TPA: DUF3667 domain-containing protein [Rhodanobacteraceae bacterium]